MVPPSLWGLGTEYATLVKVAMINWENDAQMIEFQVWQQALEGLLASLGLVE